MLQPFKYGKIEVNYHRTLQTQHHIRESIKTFTEITQEGVIMDKLSFSE